MTERTAYRPKEYVRAFGVGLSTVQRWIRNGTVETVKINGVRLVYPPIRNKVDDPDALHGSAQGVKSGERNVREGRVTSPAHLPTYNQDRDLVRSGDNARDAKIGHLMFGQQK